MTEKGDFGLGRWGAERERRGFSAGEWGLLSERLRADARPGRGRNGSSKSDEDRANFARGSILRGFFIHVWCAFSTGLGRFFLWGDLGCQKRGSLSRATTATMMCADAACHVCPRSARQAGVSPRRNRSAGAVRVLRGDREAARGWGTARKGGGGSVDRDRSHWNEATEAISRWNQEAEAIARDLREVQRKMQKLHADWGHIGSDLQCYELRGMAEQVGGMASRLNNTGMRR